jgi:hypothetical protein
MARLTFNDLIPFEDEIINRHRILDELDLEPLDTYQGMDTAPARSFKKPMASGGYSSFRLKGSDKVDKIVYGELHYLNRAKYCAMNMTASDDYDLPIFACEFDETSKRLSVTVDLMPLVDVVVHPEYREKYLDPLADIWRRYRTVPGLTDEGRCLVQRRYGPWPWARETLSPYPIDGRIADPDHRYKSIEAIVAYARVWIDLLKKAQPVTDEGYRREMLIRKRAMQKYYRDLDPGGEVIKKIFGEEQHRLFVSLIF